MFFCAYFGPLNFNVIILISFNNILKVYSVACKNCNNFCSFLYELPIYLIKKMDSVLHINIMKVNKNFNKENVKQL